MSPAEQGANRAAALLTVLLLVAVVAVMAASGLERLRLATRLGGNVVAVDQARSFAEAAGAGAVAESASCSAPSVAPCRWRVGGATRHSGCRCRAAGRPWRE